MDQNIFDKEVLDCIKHNDKNEFIKLINITKSSGPSINLKRIVRHVIETNSIEFFDALVSECNYDIHADHDFAICVCANWNYHELMKKLVDWYGANVNAVYCYNEEHNNGDHILTLACMVPNNLPTIKFLVQRGSQINADDGGPLLMSICSNRYSYVNFLVENGVDVNMDNGAALRRAIEDRYANIIDLLLDHGADVLFLNCETNASLENKRIIKKLIDAGLDHENLTEILYSRWPGAF